LRARLPQRRALVAVGSDEMADCRPAAGRADAPAEAHAGVPDPAGAALDAVHPHGAPAGEPARRGASLAGERAATTRGARVRHIPRRGRRVGQGEGAVAGGEEASRHRALGARQLPAAAEGARAPAAAAAPPSAAVAVAARLVNGAGSGLLRATDRPWWQATRPAHPCAGARRSEDTLSVLAERHRLALRRRGTSLCLWSLV